MKRLRAYRSQTFRGKQYRWGNTSTVQVTIS
jgi:hypothetical protein